MLTRIRTRVADERGVTLVEVLVAILLMAVIGSVMTTSLVRAMRATAATQSRFEALGELQKSVDRMTRELRAAEPLENTAADPNTAVVRVYRNNFTESFRYTMTYCPTQERILMRQAPAAVAWSPLDCSSTENLLIDDVVNPVGTPVFRYERADGSAVPAAEFPAKAFRILVTVRRATSEDANPNDPSDYIEVTTAVRLRNAR